LKPYLARGPSLTADNLTLSYLFIELIRDKEDYNILSKKLAQKIFSKEKKRGTVHMNEKSSRRLRSYITDYFSKHKTYQHHDHHRHDDREEKVEEKEEDDR
jgi:hypothetical protein